MMQYVENLKRTYEKDHAELMEFKKLANQNSSRNYGASGKNKQKNPLVFVFPMYREVSSDINDKRWNLFYRKTLYS